MNDGMMHVFMDHWMDGLSDENQSLNQRMQGTTSTVQAAKYSD